MESGNHLYLANAYLLSDVGINVLPSASLTLGRDRSDSATGTVAIGAQENLGQRPSPGLFSGSFGLTCYSDDAGNGCTIDDAALDGGSSVIIRNQLIADILAEDGASISLTSAPTIGVAPPGPIGFGGCPVVPGIYSGDYAAVSLQGRVTMDFENGIVQCMDLAGFELQASELGSPSLTIGNSVIQNSFTAVIAAGQSALTVSNSTIRFNVIGVDVADDAGVDLSGGQLGGMNTIACNFASNYFGVIDPNRNASIINYGLNAVNASNVAWDAPGPNLLVCSDAGVCTCAVAECTPVGTFTFGVVSDALSYPPYSGIITTGNTLSPLQCQ